LHFYVLFFLGHRFFPINGQIETQNQVGDHVKISGAYASYFTFSFYSNLASTLFCTISVNDEKNELIFWKLQSISMKILNDILCNLNSIYLNSNSFALDSNFLIGFKYIEWIQ
jgi:hypothetical protein